MPEEGKVLEAMPTTHVKVARGSIRCKCCACRMWNMSATDGLPEYMKFYYKALLDVYDEIEDEICRRGHSYRLDYAKRSAKDIVKTFLAEEKWFHQKYIPLTDKYVTLASKTIGAVMITLNSLFGMGDVVTEEAFEWLSGNPQMNRGSSIICRLMSDIVGHMIYPEIYSRTTMASSQEVPGQAVERRVAGFHPSVWGDYFLRYDPDTNMTDPVQDTAEGTIQYLVPKVKEMLTSEAGDLLEKLEMIDQVQRLGIAYHFQKEMDELLSKLHDVYPDFANGQSGGCEQLHMAALYFRLLRQQGYSVSSEVFAKFKDDSGKFCEAFVRDARGMLSLYEASHMMVHGEDILEQALTFTTVYLKAIDEEQQSPPLVNLVRQALKQPIWKGLPRLEAWHYIQTYQSDPSHNQVLLSLAKLDFNALQKIHQKEACQIVRWWKDWDFPTKMSFARDRVVECYFWALGVYYEPEFAFARKFLAKIIALTSILDDMYDTYGTPEELEAYTKAIQKWDDVIMEGLPDYMQLHHRALLAVYREAEMELASQGRLYRIPYAVQSMKDQATGYLAEAKWFFQNYTPKLDEYIILASITSAQPMLITNSLVGMGDVVTDEAFKWESGNPQMKRGSSIICRLMSDIVGHKFEQKRGHVASAVECYLKQYGGTEPEAEEALNKRVFEAWKDINKAMLRPFAVPMPVLTRLLNFTRLIDVVYKDGDNYTHSGTTLKRIISHLLVDPPGGVIPIPSDPIPRDSLLTV